MCDVLQLPRSTYYYEAKEQSKSEDELTAAIKEVFHKSRQNYGTRKIKYELKKLSIVASRRRIGRIMKENGLVSKYTVAQFKPHVDKCNESIVKK
jgi:transposase InsO family protein